MVTIPPPPKASVTQGTRRSRQSSPQVWQQEARRQRQTIDPNTSRSRKIPNTLQKTKKARCSPPFSTLKYKAPPEANLDELWKTVRSYNSNSDMTPPKQPANVPGYLRGTSSSDAKRDGSTTSKPLTTNSESTQAKLLNIKAEEKNFRAEVSMIYGISITEDSSDFVRPYRHFDTKPAESIQDTMSWYQGQCGHKDCSIWLPLDEDNAKDVARQYEYLGSIGAVEAKYAHRGRTHFFKDDDLTTGLDRVRKAFFELEWGPKPDGRVHLHCPTSINESRRRLTFDSNPDCTYWLTLKRFNPDYRSQIRNFTYVHKGPDVAAPYLTIEFKKAGKSLDHAVNQLMISISLTLFNRVLLRCRQLHHTGVTKWNAQHFQDIKHYGIAFASSDAKIYEARPELDFTNLHSLGKISHPWTGCNFTQIADHEVTYATDVIELSKWINEIHHWGLGTYSTQFERDIKRCIESTYKGDIRVSLDTAEVQAVQSEKGL